MAKHLHNSFAPVRTNCTAKWFVHGENYMAAVADAIENARYEVMITDWMLSAQIFLKRTDKGVLSLDDSSRLDKILLKKADEGVKVFLLIFHGKLKVPLTSTYFVDLGNDDSKKLLDHKNIVFILDPVIHLNKDIIWTHHEKLVIVDQTLAFVSGIDLCYGRWDNHQHRLTDNYKKPTEQEPEEDTDADVQFQTWIGLDYMNDFKAAYTHSDFATPFKDYINRSKDPRLPWHDIACCVQGDVAKDVAQHFKQRYKFSQSYQDKKQYKGLEPGDSVYSPDLIIKNPTTKSCSCQVLRSASEWSAGITTTEKSIQNAYVSAIKNAKHYVYIENQFFISSLHFKGIEVSNEIAGALKDRIAQAYKKKQKFRVILLIPLKPEFTGEFNGSDSYLENIRKKFKSTGDFSMQDITNAEMLTICRDKWSIVQRLIKEDGMTEEEISDYFSVYGLRTHDLNDRREIPVLRSFKLASEVVYIHAKCMIVDDRVTIIGSANINDRSMQGDRDSEMVVRFDDQNLVIKSEMNGVPYKAGEFAHSLRLYLFREHMGLAEGKDDDLIQDPLSDKFYKAWKDRAKKNHDIFKLVFGGAIVPCNGIKTYKELEEHKKKKGLAETNVGEAIKQLQEVKGNLVQFPLDFLQDTDLSAFGEWRKTLQILKPVNKILFFQADALSSLIAKPKLS